LKKKNKNGKILGRVPKTIHLRSGTVNSATRGVAALPPVRRRQVAGKGQQQFVSATRSKQREANRQPVHFGKWQVDLGRASRAGNARQGADPLPQCLAR
jgi:hypothetical protein